MQRVASRVREWPLLDLSKCGVISSGSTVEEVPIGGAGTGDLHHVPDPISSRIVELGKSGQLQRQRTEVFDQTMKDR